MSIEFDVVDATGAIDFSNSFSEVEKNESKSAQFHKNIFSPPYYPTAFTKKTEIVPPKSQEVQKAGELVTQKLNIKIAKHRDRDRDSGGDTRRSVDLRSGEQVSH